MDYIIKQRLDRIEQMARQILRDIQGIYGYCDGIECVAQDLPRKEEVYATTGQINGLIADTKTITEDLL